MSNGTGQSDTTKKSPTAADILRSLGDTLSKAYAGFQKGAAGGGGGGPVALPGQPGLSIPSPQPPRYGGSSLPAPIGGPSPNQPGSRQPIQSGAYSSGFEFSNPRSRDAAVVTNAIQGVSDFLSQARNRKEEKTRAQAEGYMSQIVAAQQAGDTKALNLLLEDPKVVKSLEKGLNYFMEMVPTEAPPAEAQGIKAGLDKMIKSGQRLPSPNTPGGVSIPTSQTAGAQQQLMLSELMNKLKMSQAAGSRLEKDPSLAASMGLGTSLSGGEAREAELGAVGLATLPAEERKAFVANQQLLAKIEADSEAQLKDIASKEKIAMEGRTAEERIEAVRSGAIRYAADIRKQIADGQARIRALYYQGKAGEANKVAMQTITQQINTYRNAAVKLKGKDDDMAADFVKRADELQKQYDDIQKSNMLDVDKLLNDILTAPEPE